MQIQDILLAQLNAPTKEERLAAVSKLMALHSDGTLKSPVSNENVNNHIHTTYSFSPYSPAKAVYMAWMNGLTTAGIMDHDSIAGAEEFVEAGKLIGIATTVGIECRCKMDGTPFEGMRINNPDQKSVAYLAMHGIPHQSIARTQEFFTPYRKNRNIRNRKMVENINGLIKETGMRLDFDADVAAISEDATGGSITERHILYALSQKITKQTGKGKAVLDLLLKLGVEVTGSTREKLLDAQNSMYEYYLLGALKSDMVEKFYIPATDECPHVTELVRLGEELGAISAYPYLGDVGDSVTGDKKTQAFEDAFLDELIAYVKASGFRAITYAPTRNTSAQLKRVIGLCEKYGLFQISGEDINTPFQSFICEALKDPQYRHLIDSTWALIGHELAATANIDDGMFTAKTIAKFPDLPERAAYFEKLGRG